MICECDWCQRYIKIDPIPSAEKCNCRCHLTLCSECVNCSCHHPKPAPDNQVEKCGCNEIQGRTHPGHCDMRDDKPAPVYQEVEEKISNILNGNGMGANQQWVDYMTKALRELVALARRKGN